MSTALRLRLLEEKVAALYEDNVKLAAIVFRNIKVLTLLEYNRSSATFVYTPTATVLFTNRNAVTGDNAKGAYPIHISVPSIEKMYRSNMVDANLLGPA